MERDCAASETGQEPGCVSQLVWTPVNGAFAELLGTWLDR